MLEYKFPEFEGERFIGEGAVWNRFSQEGFKVRWFNEIIYVCDYLEDGLTKNQESLYLNNFCGYSYNTSLNYRVLPFPYNLMAVANYMRIADKKGITAKEAGKRIGLRPFDAFLCKIIRKMRHI